MIHLYTGEGKGKTSIAIGMTIRMLGAGKKVLFAQFMKGNYSSEFHILQNMDNLEILKLEEDFGFYKDMSENDKLRIREKHGVILNKIMDKIMEYKGKKEFLNSKEVELLIVLDEVTYPCKWNLLDEDLLRRILTELPENMELVMTGRNPQEYMKEEADYYMELQMMCHPYQKNVRGRKGIEF